MIIPQFLIAAPMSGSGKTTVCRVLMALLVKNGFNVQPFKCGPDYIDTKYHTAVCGNPSVNLDLFMASEQHVKDLYASHACRADVCVVEGMMGMFDGYDREQGSSAAVAGLLGLPVILVVDARSVAYSVAPLLSGFARFRPDVKVAGVIFNRVGSARHYEMLQEACEDVGITCLGYLPKDKALEQDSRYLGLDFSRSSGTDAIEYLVQLLEQHVDWKQLLKITMLPVPDVAQTDLAVKGNKRIWVARNDEAFSFLYAAHVELLEHMGTVTYFDPEQNIDIPQDIDLLYLPGGYPEKHLEELSAAQQTLSSIRRYAEEGGRIWAECGGMIYLSQGVVDNASDNIHPLADILPFYITNREEERKLSLGYRQLTYKGQQLRGHEFHYTQIAGLSDEKGNMLSSVAQMKDAKGRIVSTSLFRYKNVMASYVHLYWGEVDLIQLF